MNVHWQRSTNNRRAEKEERKKKMMNKKKTNNKKRRYIYKNPKSPKCKPEPAPQPRSQCTNTRHNTYLLTVH